MYNSAREWASEIVPDEWDISYAVETLFKEINDDNFERVGYLLNADEHLKKAFVDFEMAIERIRFHKAMLIAINMIDGKAV